LLIHVCDPAHGSKDEQGFWKCSGLALQISNGQTLGSLSEGANLKFASRMKQRSTALSSGSSDVRDTAEEDVACQFLGQSPKVEFIFFLPSPINLFYNKFKLEVKNSKT
jgi:hypothetical protein